MATSRKTSGQQRQGYPDIEKSNAAFEKYYKAQGIVPEAEWDKFISTLQQPLPATFRITGFRSHAQHLLQFLKSHFFTDLMGASIDGIPIEKPKPISWYPDELAWQLSLTRTCIRKVPALENLHKFLVDETESGNISRQELVSMIPPLLMDVKPHHRVLDMCAAPGSKTAQLIEMLHAEQSEGWPEGFVIANDSDNKRCYIMVHQAKRLNSPCFMIVNHDASLLPSLMLTDKCGKRIPIRYDRILCDVPCSGDGTLRKNYMIWKKWNLGSALNLHSLQYRILLRGIELLQVGGRLIYSTCSFNPIENEAVVAAILEKSQGTIELVDTSTMLPGLRRMPGMSSWKVIADGKEIQNLDEVPANERRYRTTMWPPTNAEQFNLHRCIRMLPHHEDSGGFFVAVLQKTEHLPWSKEGKAKENAKKEATNNPQNEDAEKLHEPSYMEEVTKDVKITDDGGQPGDVLNIKTDEVHEENNKARKEENDQQGTVGNELMEAEEEPKPKKMKYQNVYKEDPFVFFKDDVDVWPAIKLYYGVKDEFPLNQMFTRCHVGKKRNLYMVNSAVCEIVQACENKLKVINCGVKVWSRSDAKGVDCDFRLAQDGIYSVFPYLTSRKVEITRNDVQVILTEENPFCAKLCKETKKTIEALAQGSVIFIYDPKKYDPHSQDLLLYIVGWRGKTSVRSFVPKGDRFHILRLCDMLPAEKMFSNDNTSGPSQNERTVEEEAKDAEAAVISDNCEEDMTNIDINSGTDKNSAEDATSGSSIDDQ
ncbi:RNA cytosine-C(5)-methyltransferase NSUN2-like isoform X2 [Anneissia japonica]|uniref:RNA cytosine-C(5)-methyltransferase NSUN2-like isoform X2 n=1 Tax=Anneissia japonica TaxID=1529436 RepID=UPI0014258824|nr:RNA cytosine-C(5)-methyltransferase NSUN2-like isoform X2 [Anneissia japonica]